MSTKAFYDTVRASLFAGAMNQAQVDGLEIIIAEARRRRLAKPFLAYILATVFHETAGTMQPIHERGPKEYFAKYEGRADLGNTIAGDGYRYRGRGYSMTTGRRNYALFSERLGIDLLEAPDLALVPKHAVAILFDGMMDGVFTGAGLRRYIKPGTVKDYVNARRVMNGLDKADLIAGYAGRLEAALADVDLLADSQTIKATQEQHSGAGWGILAGLGVFVTDIADALVGGAESVTQAAGIGGALAGYLPWAGTALALITVLAFLYLKSRAKRIERERMAIHSEGR